MLSLHLILANSLFLKFLREMLSFSFFVVEVYVVSAYTGTIADAGTDSTVYITIYGTNGLQCGPLELDTPNFNNFQSGSVDTFQLPCPYLGQIGFVKMGRNP